MKRYRLIPMKVKEYKFGNMLCTVNEDGTITPHGEHTDFGDFVYKNEEHLISSWSNKLTKIGRRLIKVYENDHEVDITPKE